MLNLDVWTIVFQIINFLALVAALYYLLVRPVMRNVAQRAAEKEQSARELAQERQEAARLRAELEAQLAHADEEATAIITAAREQEEAEELKEFWEGTLKPRMKELHKKFHTADPLSAHYLGQAMFYVDHDLANGRDPIHKLQHCWGVFKGESFREKEFARFRDLIAEASDLIEQFMEIKSG